MLTLLLLRFNILGGSVWPIQFLYNFLIIRLSFFPCSIYRMLISIHVFFRTWCNKQHYEYLKIIVLSVSHYNFYLFSQESWGIFHLQPVYIIIKCELSTVLFLAHLSRRFLWECVRCPTSLSSAYTFQIFVLFSGTNKPFSTKLYENILGWRKFNDVRRKSFFTPFPKGR